jgi:hypothetical protein
MTIYVAAYLGAIVAANLLVAAFGPAITVVNAFVFIGLDLTCRDRLHDAWHGRWLIPNMAVLIVAGGVISYAVNASAAQIAIASTVAFMLAAAADAVVYALLGDRPWMLRANGSNTVSSAVDSLVFPTIAFGAILPLTVLGLFLAKLAGGFIWSLILAVPVRRRAA